MSIRYSGDAEIRLAYDSPTRSYRGTVVDPWRRFRGAVPVSTRFRDPRSSEAYDDAARRLGELAQKWARSCGRAFEFDGKHGRVTIRRGYQAPCPLE